MLPETLELPLDHVDVKARLRLVDPERRLYRLEVEAAIKSRVIDLGDYIGVRVDDVYIRLVPLSELTHNYYSSISHSTANVEEAVRQLAEENARLREMVSRLVERLRQIEKILADYQARDSKLEKLLDEVKDPELKRKLDEILHPYRQKR